MNQAVSAKVWDIHGGIHPQENKTQSNQQAIEFAGIPKLLIHPLAQHIGAPAAPIVAVGDKVLKGQMIAAAKGFVSVPVHASTSGEVVAIEDRLIPHPSGMSGRCIIIKADGLDQWIDHQGLGDYRQLDKGKLLEHIRQSGIAGMGGAGFPAAVKLASDKTIDTLIINGTECEPYITADDRLMRERADEVIAGTEILAHLIQPQRVCIGVEDNKPEAIAALQQAATGTSVEIVVFPTKYPSGGEKQLIQILTGREVPAGGLPADIGVVCQNVGTATAIYRAVRFGEPLITRITTVTGQACQLQTNLEVLLGTPIQYLLDRCGYDASQCPRLIMGGPMMGFTLQDTAVPVVKTTNCILAPTASELPLPPPAQACIRCGMCAEACPASLLPQQMYWFARGHEWEKLTEHHLMDCIECGACSYVCPSNIPLVQYYRAAKGEIRQQQQDAIKAEQSKARFEARQARIERLELEKEQKRLARKAAAEAKASANAQGGETSDAIQAAIERAKAKKAGLTELEKTTATTDDMQELPAPADAAQAAIAKALAKRAGGAAEAPDKATLEKNLATAEKRLNTAQEKLQQAEAEGSDKLDAFKLGVEKSQQKYTQAKAELDAFDAAHPDATAEPATPMTADAAQQAIARALAKREAASSLTDADRLQNAVAALEQRLAKAVEKLAEARANQDDKLSIFEDSVSKLELKLGDARAALAEYRAGAGQ